jgi:hypothetical protein
VTTSPLTTPPPPASGSLPNARTRARVFFSGHSLLDNPLPEFVTQIAESQGQDLKWNQQNILGSLLSARTKGDGAWEGYRRGKNREGSNLDVVQELRSPATLGPGERYDTLVVTERHDLLYTLQAEGTLEYLRHLHDRFIEGNPEGVTYLFQGWLHLDKERPEAWLDYEGRSLLAWECTASRVNLALEADGRNDRVVTLPGGEALVALVQHVLAGGVRGLSGPPARRLDALFSDSVHLTPVGAYFMAAVVYASVLRKSPVGAKGPPGASPETVEDLQRIAWSVTSGYFSQPHPGQRTMEDCRQRIADELCRPFWTLLDQAQPPSGLKRLLRGVTLSRRAGRCERLFREPGSEGNPFVWPAPASLPHK